MPSQGPNKSKSSGGQRRNAVQQHSRQHQAKANSASSRLGMQGSAHYLQALAASGSPLEIQSNPVFLEFQRRVGYQAAMSYMYSMAQQAGSPYAVDTSAKNDADAKRADEPPATAKVQAQEGVQAKPLSPEAKPTEGVQAKLTMGQPGDRYEQEADQAAAQVVADKPVQALSKVPPQGLSQPLDLQPQQEDGEVQLATEDDSLQAAPGPKRQSERGRSQSEANLENRLQSPTGGRPLSPKIQASMGEKFNSDFSQVRVHDNSQAQADAASLGAKAFTKGNDIWLGKQASENDSALMGHELAHVVQQDAAVQKSSIQRTPEANTAIQAAPADNTPVQKQEESEESGGILGAVAGFFREVPGYHLLAVVIGRDPISGESVDRNATNVIRGVIGLIPGGNQLYQYLNQAGAVERAGAWLSEQITQLGLTWAYIKSLFSAAWDALAWYDLALPWRAFKKVKNVFAEPIGRLFSFAKSVGSKIMEFVLEGALSLAGAAGKTVMGILRGAGEVFMSIVRDPIGFLGNLLTSVKQGFGQFSANIWTHLKTGLMGWLFGALAGTGLQLPQKFGLKGILSIVLQVLGVTWAAIRKRIVKVIGEERMAKIEKTVSFVTDLITKGPIAAWEMITSAIGNLKDMVLGAIQNWVVTKVVKSAVTKLVSMFNPAGAIIQAAIAIYNVVMFFVERAQQIASLFKAVTGSIGKIAAGAVGAAANFIELAMARTIPVIISFLARLLGLGGIGETIKGIIKKVQKPISKGIDAVVKFIVGKAGRLLGKDKDKGKVKKEEVKDTRDKKQKDRDLKGALKEANAILDEKDASVSSVNDKLPTLKNKYGLTKVKLVNKGEDKYFIKAKINPEGTTDVEQLSVEEPAKTHIDYGNHVVTADPLTSNRGKGSRPGKLPGWPHAEMLNKVYDQWVKGHMLGEKLGGKGKAGNLSIINKAVNDAMERGPEKFAKAETDPGKNKKLYYKTTWENHPKNGAIENFAKWITVSIAVYDGDKKGPIREFPFKQSPPPATAAGVKFNLNDIGRRTMVRQFGMSSRFALDILEAKSKYGRFSDLDSLIDKIEKLYRFKGVTEESRKWKSIDRNIDIIENKMFNSGTLEIN